MLFDYGQPRHVERALALTRELRHRWTKLDGKGHRRFVTNSLQRGRPGAPAAHGDRLAGLIEQLDAGDDAGPTAISSATRCSVPGTPATRPC